MPERANIDGVDLTLASPDIHDSRGGQAESGRGPRRHCRQNAAGDEFIDDSDARATL